MADLKNSRAESRLEKTAREDGSGWIRYEQEAEEVRKKTVRLRALRLAKEAADRAAIEERTVAKKTAAKKSIRSTEKSLPTPK
jgi:hypothetical protein